MTLIAERFLAHRAAAGVALITAFGMFAGLAMDVLLAARLGATGASDALILGLTVPLVLEAVLREGSKFSLVPVMMPGSADIPGETLDLNALVNFACVAGLVIVVTLGLIAPALIRLIGPGLEEEQAALAIKVLRVSAPLVALSMIANCFAAYLNARSHFSWAAARHLSVSITVLLTAGFIGNSDLFITVFAAAMGLGYLFYLALLWRTTRGLGWSYRMWRWPAVSELRLITRQVGWPTGGFLAGQSMRVIERGLASTMAPGAVALYYFAFRIFNAVRNLIGMSLATVGLPELARRHRDARHGEFRKGVYTSLSLALIMLLPVCTAMFFGAHMVLDLVFGRGAFSSADAEAASSVLRILSIALLFLGVSPILMSVLYARRQQRAVFLIMLATASVNLVLALILVGEYGLEGIASAFVAAAVVGVTLTAYLGIRGGGARRAAILE